MHLLLFICITSFVSFHLEAAKTISCQDEKCQLCSPTGCLTTCEGPACENCPSGNCCHGEACNICIDSLCCETERCNYCVQRCSRRCSVNHIRSREFCHTRCSQMCLENQNSTGTNTSAIPDSAPSTINQNLYNVTTIIKLFNYLNNTNIIDTPVTINMTNTNNFTVHGTGIENEMQSQSSQCCYIVHPEECPDEDNKNVCFRRKHVECSYLCSSNYVLIRKEESLTNSTCIPVSSAPHWYCGKYVTENCQECYACGQESCTDQPTCSQTCKDSIVPEEFYNTPYQKNLN
ncbi:unnamed protein product [Brassicogethes aeneus]|uniref:Uncharacterized protein n=1 Tax=Brassicogethes aeneus TaxID=1431903 RepID=A0A9P0AWN3_BRAAE|nr:unnamed protein product [Brassicogethes aeneus]